VGASVRAYTWGQGTSARVCVIWHVMSNLESSQRYRRHNIHGRFVDMERRVDLSVAPQLRLETSCMDLIMTSGLISSRLLD
jgi:hypothetical protein